MAKKSKSTWPEIKGGYKKLIYCKSCGKKLEVKNFNRLLCERCGFKDKDKRKDDKGN